MVGCESKNIDQKVKKEEKIFDYLLKNLLTVLDIIVNVSKGTF